MFRSSPFLLVGRDFFLQRWQCCVFVVNAGDPYVAVGTVPSIQASLLVFRLEMTRFTVVPKSLQNELICNMLGFCSLLVRCGSI